MNRVAILGPLILGLITTTCSIIIHGLSVLVILTFIRNEQARGRRPGATFWIDFKLVATTVMITLGAHAITVCLWAALSIIVGEFEEFGTALYHAGVNYSSLGYGDIVMSPAWRMLGPVTATDGLLMFGVSTATIFAVIQRLVQIRFPDLRK
jgi:Ion channel